MAYAVRDIAGFLLGHWDIDREIVDGDDVGALRGAAEFTVDRGVIQWTETGELHWAGQTHQAGRRLLLAVRPDSLSTADVAFDDGRFFHRVDLASGDDSFVHGCSPDTYTGSWVVESHDNFRVCWAVEGPAKAITIATSYRRAD
jgi:hypothetical protein